MYDNANRLRSASMAPRTRGRATSKSTWIVAAAFLATGPPAPAQWLDPDRCVTCPDKVQHVAAGVALDLLARGPWVAKSFRNHAWKRVALTATVAASWEMLEALDARRLGKAGQRGYGFGPLDLVTTVAGAAVVEGVQGLARKLTRRRGQHVH
jgi:hypothetical protein